jgi:hypothetical protein
MCGIFDPFIEDSIDLAFRCGWCFVNKSDELKQEHIDNGDVKKSVENNVI